MTNVRVFEHIWVILDTMVQLLNIIESLAIVADSRTNCYTEHINTTYCIQTLTRHSGIHYTDY